MFFFGTSRYEQGEQLVNPGGRVSTKYKHSPMPRPYYPRIVNERKGNPGACPGGSFGALHTLVSLLACNVLMATHW